MSLSQNTVSAVVEGLRSLGYVGSLMEVDYEFTDWFSPQPAKWSVAAAAFGQTPVSYDSACIGVVCANGLGRAPLVDKCRALGAPIILEIDGREIREWSVSRKEGGHVLVDTFQEDRLSEILENRASDWQPESVLRLKNVGSYRWSQQLGLFTGLLPELEERIQVNLDPLLCDTLSRVRESYVESTGNEPNAAQIFRLIFWTLTAKVFYDRQVPGFISLTADSDEVLSAVANHYGEKLPRLLNARARQIAAERIWNEFDFRNLSVEVLAQIWANTLVDDETKRKLSVHRTSRTIVRYIVERIPFNHSGDDKRIIVEPCSGSGVFLIGAMNVLRHKLFGADASERHRYFVGHLAGIEADPFAVEISRLALTLADFPNPNGWNIVHGDVMDSANSAELLRRAGVVLCNPPYGDFEPEQRVKYKTPYVQRPAAILDQVLEHLHPEGVIGFVMPRIFVDGRGGYAAVREKLARRFRSLEITLLPDRAFQADSEIAIVVATDPIPHRACSVTTRKVYDDAGSWSEFEASHQVSTEYSAIFSIQDAAQSLVVPELPEVWDHLINYPTLAEVAELHRGIEWKLPLTVKGKETGNRSKLVKNQPSEGYKPGVAPQTSFHMFQNPPLAYLDFHANVQRTNAWKHAWEKPKAILNKAARSRGHWRLAAFPDSEGVACYQTLIGVWPKSDEWDEVLLSAILNSPVINAFVATREGKTDVTVETLKLAPVPHFTRAQKAEIATLVRNYQRAISPGFLLTHAQDPERILKDIDALVLAGYALSPRIERKLLDFFKGQSRTTVHPFSDYFPDDCTVYFSLTEFLSPDFAKASAGELIKRMRGTVPA